MVVGRGYFHQLKRLMREVVLADDYLFERVVVAVIRHSAANLGINYLIESTE